MLYLTPAAVVNIAQLVLDLAFLGYLVWFWMRRAKDPLVRQQSLLLIGFLASLAAYFTLAILNASLLHPQRLYAVYTALVPFSLALVFLGQFTYRFPTPLPVRRWEVWLAFGAGLAYTAWETTSAVLRLQTLATTGEVEYRGEAQDVALAFITVWISVIAMRQAYRAWRDRRRAPEAVHPAEYRAAMGFAGLHAGFFGLIGLFLLTQHTSSAREVREWSEVAVQLGALAEMLLFAGVYLNSVPERVSFLARVTGSALVTLLAVLGLTAYAVGSSFTETYQARLPQNRTLRFTPEAGNGYRLREVPHRFERDLGQPIHVGGALGVDVELPFAFPFYGQSYDRVFVSRDGFLSWVTLSDDSELESEYFFVLSLRHNYGNRPAIYGLVANLVDEGNVFVRAEADRVVFSWQDTRLAADSSSRYSFQITLYPSGVFDLAFDSLPTRFATYNVSFEVDAPWISGATPGDPHAEAQHVTIDGTYSGASGGARPLILDYQREFRSEMAVTMGPMALILVAGASIVLIVRPLLLAPSVVRPLRALLGAVERLDRGDFDVRLPVLYNDEIGQLTAALNDAAQAVRTARAALEAANRDLEARVAERTADLTTAVTSLEQQINERERILAELVEQQRALAVMEERARVSRDLHDSLGQVLAFVHAEGQAALEQLSRGEIAAVSSRLARLSSAAQGAHLDIRSMIVGLRSSESQDVQIFSALEEYVARFEDSTGIETRLSLPETSRDPRLSPETQVQVLYIIQEALNNIHAHARAKGAEVLVTQSDDTFQVVVADDGVGFDAARAGNSAGNSGRKQFGLEFMKERAAQIGGTLHIRSRPVVGTEVVLLLPCAPPPAEELKGLRIMLADDHPLAVEGVANVLRVHGAEVVGVAADGRQAVALAEKLLPDLLLLDMHMPGLSGAEAAREIKAFLPEVRAVIFTAWLSEEDVRSAEHHGADGYLLKTESGSSLVESLRRVNRGERIYPPESLLAKAGNGSEGRESDVTASLTPRQREVLALVASGLTYKGVAAKLTLSEATVQYHMNQIQSVLRVRNKAEAVALALRKRLIG